MFDTGPGSGFLSEYKKSSTAINLASMSPSVTAFLGLGTMFLLKRPAFAASQNCVCLNALFV